MKVDGKIMDIMVKEFLNFLMEVNIKANGRTIKRMVKESIITQMEIFIMGNF